MATAYRADTDALGLGRPDFEPLASDAMREIIELIEALIARGHAYAVEGDVYFAVRSYPAYGEISHQRIDRMDQGEGVEGAERKRDPLDFALWKAQKAGEDTAWDSPWGRGRPGWHIECSAMAQALLGIDFEIHGGGSDLIFPHHENEAAQTFGACGAPLARLWVHNGMVRLEQQKMAKSVGNLFVLHDALAAYGRDALIMYFCAGHYRQPIEFDDERLQEAVASVGHYRQPIEFDDERLQEAVASVRRIREAARRLTDGQSPAWSSPLRERFFEALAVDFNTPTARAAMFEWVREANASSSPVGDADLREMLDVLGLANLLAREDAEPPPDVLALRDARERARSARNYAEADRLRDEVRARGWEVRDGPGGPELLPQS
jgi:cysteinyl-tRNA synthetase